MREEIEERIRAVLATEKSAIALSYLLFTQGEGLFSQLAETQEERAALVRTPLFRQAQARLTELQRAESAELVASVDRIKAAQKAAAAAGQPVRGTNGPPAPANGAPADSPARTDTPA